MASGSGSGSVPAWLGTGPSGVAGGSSVGPEASEPVSVPHLSQPSSPPLLPGGTAARAEPGASRRERFEAGELAIVCSHYDLGVIETVKEFRRGSSRSPKVLLVSSKGRYLLKRRAPSSREGPARVGYCHALQAHLAQRKFPLPPPLGTRSDGATMLQLGERIYELFEYIPGNSYDGSLDATGDAGRLLAFFHRLVVSFKSDHRPPTSSYHNSPAVAERLGVVAERLGPEAGPMVARLREAYAEAAAAVQRLGLSGWPVQIIHADWHPGNMLFRGSRVVAVIDYDTARICPRIIDVANGALQFSITMQGQNPDTWPPGLDEGRLKRFCRGYEMVKGCILSTAEIQALPSLMIEALVVEAALPIAATGHFAGIDGGTFLRMVDRKVAWIREHGDRLTALIGG